MLLPKMLSRSWSWSSVYHFLSWCRCGRSLRSLLRAPTFSTFHVAGEMRVFIFGSSGGPHDPVQPRTQRNLTLRRGRPIHSHPHRRLRTPLQHAWPNPLDPALLGLCVFLRPSVRGARRSSGTLRVTSEGGGGVRCFSAGPTSQLSHCSSSPPSGKPNTLTCAGS